MTGRVAVLKAYGGDFEPREYPVPDPNPHLSRRPVDDRVIRLR